MADASPETTAPRRRSRRRPPGRQIARQPTDTAPQRGSVRRVRSGPDHLSAAFVQEAAANSGGFAVSRFEPEKRHGAKWGQPPSSGVSTAIAKREAASPQGCPLRWGGVAARFSAARSPAKQRARQGAPLAPPADRPANSATIDGHRAPARFRRAGPFRTRPPERGLRPGGRLRIPKDLRFPALSQRNGTERSGAKNPRSGVSTASLKAGSRAVHCSGAEWPRGSARPRAWQKTAR